MVKDQGRLISRESWKWCMACARKATSRRSWKHSHLPLSHIFPWVYQVHREGWQGLLQICRHGIGHTQGRSLITFRSCKIRSHQPKQMHENIESSRNARVYLMSRPWETCNSALLCPPTRDVDDAASSSWCLDEGVHELAQMQSRFEVGAHQKLVVLSGYRHDWVKKACPGVVILRKDQTSFGLCSSILQAIVKPMEWSAMELNRISSFPSKVELTSFISFSLSAGDETSQTVPVTL